MTGSEGASEPVSPPDAVTGAEFVALLHQALRQVRRAAQERLEPTGTTPGQHRMLRALDRAGAPVRLRELARVLDVVPRSVTSKVDDAELAGLVRRSADPADGRATLVELTPRGREVLGQANAWRSARAGDLLAGLDPAERQDLLRLLRRVAGEDDG
ncbi:MarR family winged helix-turn-helix transcriptional regulator [Sanguibacter suaedae]|uniref:MarR family transcriptional regulator n=1 Tax=Sanguibacter suaedae TaxID=2795737 RepID=A0A934IBU6_9MICO|nr:MarR family transcriptional regulator [Sanguibacter suaedae]MBI9114915.1 MarR family transcriptional regulator [Sanguibacter suaedae]